MLPPSYLAVLLDCTALALRLHAPDLVVLDIRYGPHAAAFEAGHIPGALHTDYQRDGWRRRDGDVPGLLPDREHLETLLGNLGVAPGNHVVIVTAGEQPSDIAAGARIFWTLRMIGHERLSLLDGGMRAWRADPARLVEAGPSRARPRTAYPVTFVSDLHAPLDHAAASFTRSDATFVDARSPAGFAGREKSGDVTRAGHVPGAIPSDYADLVDPATGCLRPRDELALLLSPIPAGPTVSYCNTGHTAALVWFVLAEVLGRPGARLFDGSMSQWSRSDLPMRILD
jgi:thiosulfate/3-mercaptopyruvate sulfurtransferase